MTDFYNVQMLVNLDEREVPASDDESVVSRSDESEGPVSDEEKEDDIYPNIKMTREEIIFNTSQMFNKNVFKIILFLSERSHIRYSSSELIEGGAVFDSDDSDDSDDENKGETAVNYFYDLPEWDFDISANFYEYSIRVWISNNFDKMKVLLRIIEKSTE